MSECTHDNWDEYFDKCEDCGVTLEQLPQEVQKAYKLSLEG